MELLDISEITRRSGLPASTLRYYEERGLIESPSRRSGRRQYAPTVIERLALIALGRASGFSLDDIAAMVDADGNPSIDRQALLDKADDLDRRISRLTAMRDGLHHAAACKAPTHLACPTFQSLLSEAGAATFDRPPAINCI